MAEVNVLVDAQEHFVKLFLVHQNKIYAYIATLLPKSADAEDVFQQVSLICWKKWETFEPDGNFLRWACGIARFEIMNYLRRMNYRQTQHLSEEVVGVLSKAQLEMEETLSRRRSALQECLAKLKDEDKQLVQSAYTGSKTIKALAEEVGIAVDTFYARLKRIRKSLMLCIKQELG